MSFFALFLALLIAQFPFPIPQPKLPIPVPGLPQSIPIPPVLRDPPPVTTTFTDAIRRVPALDDFSPRITRSLSWLSRTTDGAFNLSAGAYGWTVQSYCLKVTAHAPGDDAAYVLAPLHGSRAQIVQAVVARAEQHPEIAQPTIQLLLWTITSRASIAATSADVRAAADVLLTHDERKSVDGGVLGQIPPAVRDALLAQAPQAVREAFATEQQVRDLLTNGNASYQDIERIAAPRAHANNNGVPRARWGYVAPGYFLRLHSDGYSHMRIEIYVPEGWSLQRDGSGRIASVSAPTGEAIRLAYTGNTARAQFTVPHMAVEHRVIVSAATTLPVTWTHGTDDAALSALESALRAAPTGAAWSATTRDFAADAVARTRADLVCRSMGCITGANVSMQVALSGPLTAINGAGMIATFSPVGMLGAPSDAGLQPLAPSVRGADGGGSPPFPGPTLPPPCNHAGTSNDPIPVECLPKVPPDPKADCQAVAEEIAFEQIVRSIYADPKYVQQAVAAGRDGSGYESIVSPVIDARFSTNGGSPGGAPESTVQVGGGTDPETCEITMYLRNDDTPAAVWQAMIAHEGVHAKTCHSIPPAKRLAADTPAARSADEVAAYTASIAYMQTWYALHCH